MIGILHGYLLEGSGSNIWTRSIIQELCQQGETVHLICQENHPERYDFIAKAYQYRLNGTVELMLQQKVSYSGRCIIHKPQLGNTLPVYVWDHYEEFSSVIPMIELSTDEIEVYLQRNVRVVSEIVQKYGITVFHANHAVLMSVVAQRISHKYGIPYAIMPHGSAMEYAVKKDKRLFDYALSAFSDANKIFVIGPEIEQRVKIIFSDIPNIEDKMKELNIGVDTSLFEPIDRAKRKEHISHLNRILISLERGKSPELYTGLIQRLSDNVDHQSLQEMLNRSRDYDVKLPDEDVGQKLSSINWHRDKIILFVGRLIASKGLQSIIAALPQILAEAPETKLLVVGHGPLREVMEALIWALSKVQRKLVEKIVQWGKALESSNLKPFITLQHYFNNLADENRLYDYYKNAERYMQPDKVIFTGYLTHRELRYLFPCCDIAIFPSIVAEAGPLVFLEALACGCFPQGTYFAGMGANIDSIAQHLPPQEAELMKLSEDERQTIMDITTKAPKALNIAAKNKPILREIAVEKYDWSNVSKKFADELTGVIK